MNSENCHSTKDLSCKIDKYYHIKKLITSTSEYIKQPSETTASVVQKNLNVLCTVTDLSVFDPGTSIATEFYVSLHNLTNRLVTRISLLWSVLDVLQCVCKNKAARHALIHMYKFPPIVLRLLETNLTPEKQLKLLKLLQELTFCERIYWQEANYPSSISTLSQMIMQSKEEEIVSLSLTVLVNLCYRNLPAIYTLVRIVDIKALHRTLLKIQRNVNTRVQCCKLLIMMEQLNKDIPDKFILEFTTVSFETLVAALAKSDVLVLKHIVEFFNDLRQNEHSRSVLMTYPNYMHDVENILQQLEQTSDAQCVALVLDFLHSLVQLKISSLMSLYPTYVKIAMRYVVIDHASSKALALIRTVIVTSKRTKGFNELISEVDLSVLMLVIGNEDDEMDCSNEKRNIELNSRVIELIQLLQEMCKIPNLCDQVTKVFSEQTIRRLLRPILEQDDIIPDDNWPGNVFLDTTTTVYIYALLLTANLAVQNSDWLKLYSELIEKKQIQMIIALVLFTGDSELKQKCLQLMTSVGFSQKYISSVAKCMCQLEPLVLIQDRAGVPTIPVQSVSNFNIDMVPLFSLAQEEQLDAALEQLNDLSNEGKITDVSASAVIELYGYKLASIKHAKTGIQVSHEAANAYATCLQHRLVQVVAESNRLSQLLFYTQKNKEILETEQVRMNSKHEEAEEESKKIYATQRQEIEGLKKIVAEKSETIQQLSKLKHELDVAMNKNEILETKIREVENERKNMDEKAKSMTNKIHELNKCLKKLEDSVIKRDNIIEAKQREIETGQQSMSALEQENDQLLRQCRNYEQKISEKEEEVKRTTSELTELNRMREMICSLAAKKTHDRNETT